MLGPTVLEYHSILILQYKKCMLHTVKSRCPSIKLSHIHYFNYIKLIKRWGDDLPPVPDLNQFSAVVFPRDFSGLVREYLSPKIKHKRL